MVQVFWRDDIKNLLNGDREGWGWRHVMGLYDGDGRRWAALSVQSSCRQAQRKAREQRMSPEQQQQEEEEEEKESCGPVLIKAVGSVFLPVSQEKLLRAPNLQQTHSIILASVTNQRRGGVGWEWFRCFTIDASCVAGERCS